MSECAGSPTSPICTWCGLPLWADAPYPMTPVTRTAAGGERHTFHAACLESAAEWERRLSEPSPTR